MYWFELLISASLFTFLLGLIINNYIYPDITSADNKAIAFMEQMRAKYCLYKLLATNNWTLDNVLDYLVANNFTYLCNKNEYYIFYTIEEVPTGKSPSCTNCIFFNISNNGDKYVCVNNATAVIKANFVEANGGSIVDNLWSVNATDATYCAKVESNYIVLGNVTPYTTQVWGYNISGGIVTNPIYIEKVWLNAKYGMKVKVKFTLS